MLIFLRECRLGPIVLFSRVHGPTIRFLSWYPCSGIFPMLAPTGILIQNVNDVADKSW